MAFLLMLLLLFTALFLILLVLVQRGKGGGLAGALGGMGGQSAFGTKAGDMFTKITIGVAAFWIVLCLVSVRILSTSTKGGVQLGTDTTVEQKEGASQQGPGPAIPPGSGANGDESPSPGGG